VRNHVWIGLRHLLPSLAREDRCDQRLSLEEQQRLAFARLLLHRPRWGVRNDTLSALDKEHRKALLAIFEHELADTAVGSIAAWRAAASTSARCICGASIRAPRSCPCARVASRRGLERPAPRSRRSGRSDNTRPTKSLPLRGFLVTPGGPDWMPWSSLVKPGHDRRNGTSLPVTHVALFDQHRARTHLGCAGSDGKPTATGADDAQIGLDQIVHGSRPSSRDVQAAEPARSCGAERQLKLGSRRA
jgi:hypothetical protein